MTKSLTELRKSPAQARAVATFEAIVDAAAHILGEGGATALTTNKIAERAGASIGSVYQYFPNKQAIVRALLERQIRRAESLRPDVLDDIDAAASDVVRAAVDWWFDVHTIEPALARELRSLAADALPNAELHRLSQLRRERLRGTVGRLLSDKARIDNAAFVFDVCLSALSNEALRRQPDLLSSESFRSEVTMLLTRYLK